jgi:hypothetical protein
LFDAAFEALDEADKQDFQEVREAKQRGAQRKLAEAHSWRVFEARRSRAKAKAKAKAKASAAKAKAAPPPPPPDLAVAVPAQPDALPPPPPDLAVAVPAHPPDAPPPPGPAPVRVLVPDRALRGSNCELFGSAFTLAKAAWRSASNAPGRWTPTCQRTFAPYTLHALPRHPSYPGEGLWGR